MRRQRLKGIAAIITVLVATANAAGCAPSKGNPESLDKLAIGEDEVKQLLLLMDTDKNGKVSKKGVHEFHGSGVLKDWIKTRVGNWTPRN